MPAREAQAGQTRAGGEAHYGERSEEWGRQAAYTVLRHQPAVDAIFCGSEQIARGVADALREAGRRIPDDIALVGYDNCDVFAETGRPTLTTVDMRLKSLGKQAARRLLEAIGGQSSRG